MIGLRLARAWAPSLEWRITVFFFVVGFRWDFFADFPFLGELGFFTILSP